MAAQQCKAAASFLRGAGLLAGILAIVAGILGMHVMTGTHHMHSPAAVGGTTTAHTVVVHDGHAAGGHRDLDLAGSPAVPASDAQDGPVGSEQCLCSGGCSSAHTMAAPCIPSAKTASLSAPMPGTSGYGAAPNPGSVDAILGHWSYLPGSPSPGELSISRT